MSIGERIVRQGWDVYTADDKHVGVVGSEHADYIHVNQGRLFGASEYYFPSWMVGRVDRDASRVYLTVDEDELRDRDWSAVPRAGETREQRYGATSTTMRGAATETGVTSRQEFARQEAAEVETLDQREIVVPVVEERLDITKRAVELGEVVISRQVVEREQMVPVDVAHEEVRVERRSASREATPDDLRLAAGEGLARLAEEGVVIVPVIEEVVEVRKRMMVREELVITKQRVTERHEITERVRRVEPTIESSGRLEREVETTATSGVSSPRGANTPVSGRSDDRSS